MSQRLIAVHGNPGYAGDFGAIANLFPADVSWGHFQLNYGSKFSVSKSINSIIGLMDGYSPSQVTMLAYSWGSYLALRTLAIYGAAIKQLICINPYFKSPDAVSGLVTGLNKISLVAKPLFGVLAPRLATGYCKKLFAPRPASSLLEEGRLSNAGVWRRAIEVKNEQYCYSLKTDRKFADRIDLLVGSDDQVSSWDEQSQVANDLGINNDVRLHQVDGAGHSLLWTDKLRVKEIIDNIGSMR